MNRCNAENIFLDISGESKCVAFVADEIFRINAVIFEYVIGYSYGLFRS